MGELELNPELLTIVMFVMIVIIQGQFYHSDRRREKRCIIDEAWRFLARGSNPVCASFMSRAFVLQESIWVVFSHHTKPFRHHEHYSGTCYCGK
ncbi:hypothetical protein PGH45_19085 [Legionella pneumophila]|nr:hypothetical protein [Legionella pneumophila]